MEEEPCQDCEWLRVSTGFEHPAFPTKDCAGCSVCCMLLRVTGEFAPGWTDGNENTQRSVRLEYSHNRVGRSSKMIPNMPLVITLVEGTKGVGSFQLLRRPRGIEFTTCSLN